MLNSTPNNKLNPNFKSDLTVSVFVADFFGSFVDDSMLTNPLLGLSFDLG
jgi:hypothetical protein